MLGLTAYLTGRLFIDHPGLPIVVVFAGRHRSSGPLLGLVNGVLVAFGKVPALVITLGTLYIYRGIVLTWAGSDRINARDMPEDFLDARHQVGRSAIPVLHARRAGRARRRRLLPATPHRGGRELYAIGSDPDAAVLYGLPVRRRVLAAFVLSGALAGLAGVVYAARYGTVSSGAGTGIELQAVAAAVIGGVAIFGGSGTVWGAAIGAILLVTINRALPILGIPDFWQRAVVGALILGAIVLDRVLAGPTGTQARGSEGRVMTRARPSTRRRRRPRPTRRTPAPCGARVLLTREVAVIALLVARLRSTPSTTSRTSTAR